MFTGIIEELGTIVSLAESGGSLRLTVFGPVVVGGARRGDSICVDGVCLTVVEQGGPGEGTFTADVMPQTIAMSTIGELQPGARVNLERAAEVGGRLGGHIVQGHIDGTAAVASVSPGEAWSVVRLHVDNAVARLIVDKGSVALAGVSLTVSSIGEDAGGHWFEVSLIPETLAATTLGALAPGDRVNLETDVLARHVERLLSFGRAAA